MKQAYVEYKIQTHQDIHTSLDHLFIWRQVKILIRYTCYVQ